jgi:dsRNA-specific ribonuclease
MADLYRYQELIELLKAAHPNTLGSRTEPFTVDELILVRKSLTHRSADSTCHYDVLEWYGDRLYNFIVSQWLDKRFGESVNAGILTEEYTRYVDQKTCARLARLLRLNDYARHRLGDPTRSHQYSHGIEVMLADMFESFLYSLYCCYESNGQTSAIFGFVFDLLNAIQQEYMPAGETYAEVAIPVTNYMSLCNMYFQKLYRGAEVCNTMWQVIRDPTGMAHCPVFIAYLLDPKSMVRVAEGRGSSKAEAKTAAARSFLETNGITSKYDF